MKKIKIALSLILAIALTSIMVLPAFAAGTTCNCGHAPVIQVRGIGETLYAGEVAEGNEIFSTDNIVNGILPVMPQLAQFLLDTSNTELFVGAAETAVKTIFAPVMYDNNANRTAVDENGNPVPVVVKCDSRPVEQYMVFDGELTEEGKLSKALYDELGNNHVYFFTYDWTGDPTKIVADLQAFIDDVKDQSGHKKVSINAESMGGAIVSLYLNTYGYGDIENLVMANSAFNGLEMLGQLFTGNVQIDGDALAFLLAQEILSNPELGELVSFIPVFEQLASMANDIMSDPATKQAVYDRIFVPVFAYMPSFWCLVPGYSFDAAKDAMFGENTANWGETRAKAGSNLLKIVNKVGYAAKNTDNIVKDMVGYTYILDLGFLGQKEIVVDPKINSYANVTNYNRYIAPVTPSANWNSDGVIEVYNASGFARAADMGYTLGENYVQELHKEKNYVSPDNVIDASLCQAPDNTWFIKNLGHIKYSEDDGTTAFYVWLLTATEEYTIDTNADYPQFMYYDTSIPELMTWEEKAENDANSGITIPSIPGLDIDLEGLASALEQVLKGFEDMGFDLGELGDLDLGNLDLSAITDLIGNINLDSILGLLGSLDLSAITGLLGSLGDILGGLLGGGGETPTPEAPTPETPAPEAPAPETPAPEAPSTPNTNVGNSGSSNINRAPAQNTGLVLSGTPVFSSGSSVWVILFIVAAVIAGILIIKL